MKELHDGVEFFDGEPVEHYEGRFSGTFEVEPEEGITMSSGDLICIMVTARVSSPKFAKNKINELKRTNVLKVEDAIPLSLDKAQYLLDQINKKVNGVNDGIVEVMSAPQPIGEAAADSINPGYGTLYNQFVGG